MLDIWSSVPPCQRHRNSVSELSAQMKWQVIAKWFAVLWAMSKQVHALFQTMIRWVGQWQLQFCCPLLDLPDPKSQFTLGAFWLEEKVEGGRIQRWLRSGAVRRTDTQNEGLWRTALWNCTNVHHDRNGTIHIDELAYRPFTVRSINISGWLAWLHEIANHLLQIRSLLGWRGIVVTTVER